MENNSTFLVFSELTLHEQANLSGGGSVGGRGQDGKPGGPGKPGKSGKPGKPGRSSKSGKLSKADRRILNRTLMRVSNLMSDLF